MPAHCVRVSVLLVRFKEFIACTMSTLEANNRVCAIFTGVDLLHFYTEKKSSMWFFRRIMIFFFLVSLTGKCTSTSPVCGPTRGQRSKWNGETLQGRRRGATQHSAHLSHAATNANVAPVATECGQSQSATAKHVATVEAAVRPDAAA